MAPRGRPRAFDRDAALDAATAVFWRKGFTASSMAELCAAMGINAPSLYAAFGSKEELYALAVARYGAKAGQAVWGGVEGAVDARAAVASVLMASAAALPRPDGPKGCMVALSSVGAEGEERLGAMVRDARAEGVRMLEARFARARAEGELPAGLDLSSLARFYSCVIMGMSIQARDGADRDQLEDVARCALAAWPALTAVPGPAATAGTSPAPPAPPAR